MLQGCWCWFYVSCIWKAVLSHCSVPCWYGLGLLTYSLKGLEATDQGNIHELYYFCRKICCDKRIKYWYSKNEHHMQVVIVVRQAYCFQLSTLSWLVWFFFSLSQHAKGNVSDGIVEAVAFIGYSGSQCVSRLTSLFKLLFLKKQWNIRWWSDTACLKCICYYQTICHWLFKKSSSRRLCLMYVYVLSYVYVSM